MTRRMQGDAPDGRAPITGWLVLALIVIVVDQVTKVGFDNLLSYGERLPVLPFFDFVLLYNRGAAFSFLAGADGWQRWFFTLLGVVAVPLLIWLIRRHHVSALAARAAAGPARTAVGPSQHLQPWTVAVQSSTAGITTSASPSPAPKRAAACVIGDELLNGKVQDSNTVTLARALFNVRPVHGVGRSVRVHCRKLNRSWNGPFELTRVGRHRAPPCGNGPGRH